MGTRGKSLSFPLISQKQLQPENWQNKNSKRNYFPNGIFIPKWYIAPKIICPHNQKTAKITQTYSYSRNLETIQLVEYRWLDKEILKIN